MNRVLTLALLLVALPASPGLYKWVDQNGRVHYSDQPPPDNAKKSAVIHGPAPAKPSGEAANPAAPGGDAASAAPAAANAAPKTAKTAAELEMEFRKRRMEAAEAEAKRQQEAQASEEKKRNCTQATNRVAALEGGGRVTKYGPNGEALYLSDAEIGRELADARKVADSWCK
jgi:type IV secretory pathway VirB10-like protein